MLPCFLNLGLATLTYFLYRNLAEELGSLLVNWLLYMSLRPENYNIVFVNL